jgi:hypothetical protein
MALPLRGVVVWRCGVGGDAASQATRARLKRLICNYVFTHIADIKHLIFACMNVYMCANVYSKTKNKKS